MISAAAFEGPAWLEVCLACVEHALTPRRGKHDTCALCAFEPRTIEDLLHINLLNKNLTWAV